MSIPITVFLAGLAAIVYSVATGQADVSLVVIFPVFSGSSSLFILGVVLIVLSFFVAFAMLATSTPAAGQGRGLETTETIDGQNRRRTSYGGVVLIGPIPIAFGSDKNMATTMLVAGIVLAIILIIALFILG
jgi:uncharacterized protein (TIGR00304 family)